MVYVIITVVLFALILVYFKIADRFNIIDKPNARSSHSVVTIRGGGVLFPIAVLIAFALGHASWAVTVAVVLVGIVSFVDDVRPLHQLPRFSAHLISALLIMFDLGLFSQMIWLLPFLLIAVIAWINAFNFMDGINGITVLYALVALVSFGYLYHEKPEFELIAIVALSCIVFGFFNVRKKARTFAGDVGSVSMAVFLAYLMLKTIFDNGNPAYLLFFSVYGIDAFITILYRLKRKENIFQPHRSHLYQYLANEMKWPHLAVSFVYALLQLSINAAVIFSISRYGMDWMHAAVALLALAGVYVLVRFRVRTKIAS